MRILLVLLALFGCGDRKHVQFDAVPDDTPADVPFPNDRHATSVLVNAERVSWSLAPYCALDVGCGPPGVAIASTAISTPNGTPLFVNVEGVPHLAGDAGEIYFIHTDQFGGMRVARAQPGRPLELISAPFPATNAIFAGPVTDASYVYWFDPGFGGSARFMRAGRAGIGNDATMLTTTFPVFPAVFAVTGGYMWWTSASSPLYRVASGGGTPETFSSTPMHLLGVSATEVFVATPIPNGTRISAIDFAGTMRTVTDATADADPFHFVIAGTELYWTSFSGIYRAPITGGAQEFLVAAQADSAIGVTANAILFGFDNSSFQTLPR